MTEQWIFDTVKVIHAEIDRLRESGQLRETNSREEPKHIDRKYAALREAVSALYDLADFYESISDDEVSR
jgi:hypothetical protein